MRKLILCKGEFQHRQVTMHPKRPIWSLFTLAIKCILSGKGQFLLLQNVTTLLKTWLESYWLKSVSAHLDKSGLYFGRIDAQLASKKILRFNPPEYDAITIPWILWLNYNKLYVAHMLCGMYKISFSHSKT